MKQANIKRRTLLVGGLASLAACSSDEKITRRYNGPLATGIVVHKGARKMYMMNGQDTMAAFDVDLGFNPQGHKQQEGDGRTPEGQYYIDRRNYNSAFFLSLGISYPNNQDRARARAAGVSPGGDIFIHGTENGQRDQSGDWTAGCISVTNAEMQMIYQMVPMGVPIWIEA